MKALDETIKELERELARPDGGVPGYVVMLNGRDLLDLLLECKQEIDDKDAIIDLRDDAYHRFWLRGLVKG